MTEVEKKALLFTIGAQSIPGVEHQYRVVTGFTFLWPESFFEQSLELCSDVIIDCLIDALNILRKEIIRETQRTLEHVQ